MYFLILWNHPAREKNEYSSILSKKGKFNFLILNPRLFYYDHKLLHIGRTAKKKILHSRTALGMNEWIYKSCSLA